MKKVYIAFLLLVSMSQNVVSSFSDNDSIGYEFPSESEEYNDLIDQIVQSFDIASSFQDIHTDIALVRAQLLRNKMREFYELQGCDGDCVVIIVLMIRAVDELCEALEYNNLELDWFNSAINDIRIEFKTLYDQIINN